MKDQSYICLRRVYRCVRDPTGRSTGTITERRRTLPGPGVVVVSDRGGWGRFRVNKLFLDLLSLGHSCGLLFPEGEGSRLLVSRGLSTESSNKTRFFLTSTTPSVEVALSKYDPLVSHFSLVIFLCLAVGRRESPKESCRRRL